MPSVAQSVFDTIRFFDLYDMPVTATQVWERLVVSKSGYAHHPSLQEVQQALVGMEGIEMKWGYYFLQGKSHLVRQRLVRHAIAQDKWKILLRCAPFLAWVPFVRSLAGSGSLAQDNTKVSSDLDVLVIVREGRIWTTRLLLLIVTSVLGRRRKYYDRNAPDMVCLNHYIAESSLPVASAIQNVAMAMQYASLVSLYYDHGIRNFKQRNAVWIDGHVRFPVQPDVRHKYTILLGGIAAFFKHQLELLLQEPLGDYIEEMAEYIQRWMVKRHQDFSRPGRIALSSSELAFHPDTKIPAIVRLFGSR